MSEERSRSAPDRDPILERIVEDRRPGEIESGMMSGSDEADISATERFEGELTEEEALQVLDPERKILDTQPGG